MSRRNTVDDYVADEAAVEQPDSVTDLQPIVEEFVKRLKVIELEEEELKEHKKDLMEEFKKKLDTKTLNLAIRMMKLREKVEHKHTFDIFTTILSKDEIV